MNYRKKTLISKFGGTEAEWRRRARDVSLFMRTVKDRFNGSYGWYEKYAADLLYAWWPVRETESLLDTDTALWHAVGDSVTDGVESMWRAK